MVNLTDRQRQILWFICRERERNGYAPTIAEIGAAMGIASKNGVSDHLKALERKGYIRRGTNKARSIVPVEAM